MMSEYNLKVKRVYAAAEAGDGQRVLVDRLWPRGLSKDKARVDYWRRDVAPSTELRRWFGHDAERWAEFRSRYEAELAANPAASDFVAECAAWLAAGPVTLLYGAKDEEHNQAVVLRQFIIDNA